MCNKESKKFKKFIKRKEKSYFNELNKKIRNLKSTNPKEYWNILNKSTEGRHVQPQIAIQVFLEHFKKLGKNSKNADVCENFDSHFTGITNDEINIDFTLQEIVSNIQKLKNKKACGIDYIRNEFLKNLPPRLLPFTCNFFNLILETGAIPSNWCIGMIMPLYKKKGSQEDPNNYRGITLLSCLGKLFTACLNNRIEAFSTKYEKLGLEQAGFRPGFSTLDHIFTLHAIIDFYKNKKERAYCAFIDYSKAFDLVDRSALWQKVLNHGINGRVLQVIYNMYPNAQSCVKSVGKLSDFFTCDAGVRQGENLSPILFAMYVNDFHESLTRQYSGLNMLNENVMNELDVCFEMYLLLYADDTIIMAESAEELQSALQALDDYCKAWSLTVNIDKTKVVNFSRGKVTKHPTFKLGENVIEVVGEYVYLGVIFNYNGLFTKAINKQITQAKKAMFALLEKAKILKLPIDITYELFERMVLPILLYGSEVWGACDLSKVEIFHRNFIRILLKTFKFTPNCMLYGELGVTDISTNIKSRMVNFWTKLKFDDTKKISSTMYHLLVKLTQDYPEQFNFKWVDHVKDVIDKSDFSYVWNEEWLDKIANNSQCDFYKMFKESLLFENYLIELDPSDRYVIAKFRTRTRHLPVTRNRFQEKSNTNILCPLCDHNAIGDEVHFLFKCPYFQSEQQKFIPKLIYEIQHQDVKEAVKVLFKSGIETLKDLAKFAKLIMAKFRRMPRYPAKHGPELKKVRLTRSGREIKPPSRLDL